MAVTREDLMRMLGGIQPKKKRPLRQPKRTSTRKKGKR